MVSWDSSPPRYMTATLTGGRCCLYTPHGFVKLLRLRLSSGERVPLSSPTCPLGSPLRTRDFGPTLEAVPHLFSIRRRRQEVASGAEMLGNRTIRGQKALRMSRRLKPVAYLLLADNISGPLSIRLRRANQPVISTQNALSTFLPSLLDDI